MATYLFYKPKGCVTARRDALKKTVMDYFPEEFRDRFHPVGRLDLDTEGLLLITDDGKLDQQLLLPDRHVSKRYFFCCLGNIDEQKAEKLENGIELYHKNVEARPAIYEPCGHDKIKNCLSLIPEHFRAKWMRNPDGDVTSGYLTITEGKKHQVKLMIKSLGCRVFYLKRVSIGDLTLDESLKPGEYRELTEEELALLTNPTEKKGLST